MNQSLPSTNVLRKPGKEKPMRYLFAAVALLITSLFILELQVPVGVEVWLPNVAVVLLSLWFPHRWQTYLTTAVCSVLTLLGFFLSPMIVPTWVAAVNLFLGILMFWITASVGLAARRTHELQAMNRMLLLEIAERKRGEEKLSEQASLLDLAQDAILVQDMGQKIVFWNRGAERLYGWSAVDALGRDAVELLSRSEYQESAPSERFLRENGKWSGALRQWTKDGKNIVVDSHWTLVRDESSLPKSILIVNTDVTEKMKLESQLLRTQRLESVGVLAGGVAHDFNNLLTPILMASKLLREDRPDAERQRLLATLEASAERGREMARQLLAFAGGTENVKAPVQLRQIVREIKSILDHAFPKAIEIETHFSATLPPILADATQVSQVLMNLCVNARDAMPEGGVLSIDAAQVSLDEEFCRLHPNVRPGAYARLVVKDSGMGIPPQVLDRIFDPFFTTKSQGKGTGLGLSTVLGIVHAHDGCVEVFSEHGSGSRFCVYFPLSLDGGVIPEEESAADAPTGQGERILLIDDEPAILETARSALESNGYRALTAVDGPSGLALFAEHPHDIDAVLVDMMMPGMDGQATVAALRQLSPEVRVIASSGIPPAGRLAAEIGAGDTAFLPKPYSVHQMLTVIARTLKP